MKSNNTKLEKNINKPTIPAAILSIFLPMMVSAQGTDSRSGPLEEVLVTASKRGAQTLQDIPISIQAFSGEDLARRGVVEFGDYAREVSGLSFEDQGPGDKKYVLRGTQSTGAATTGVYFDDIVLTGNNRQDGGGRQPDVRLVDMERIEVLKGPQGTLYGSSSMSGTIRMITSKPDASKFAGAVNANLGNTRNASGESYNVDAMLNVPIIKDKLAIRLVGYTAEEAGWVDDNIAYGDKRSIRGVNETEVTGGRAALRWQVTDDVRLDAMFVRQDTDTDGASWYQPLYGEFVQNNYQALPWNESMDAYNLALEWATEHGTFTASTSYMERDIEYRFDGTRILCGIFTGRNPLCKEPQAEAIAIRYSSLLIQPQDRSIFSSELRYASSWEGRLQVVGGLFYQEEENNFNSVVSYFDTQGNPLPLSDRQNIQVNRRVNGDIKQQAAFAEVSYDLTDRLTATVGLRAFKFEVDEVGQNLVTRNRPVDATPVVTDSSEDDISPKFNLSHDVTNDIMLYATYAEGFRSGGNNEPDFTTGTVFPGFQSDSLKSYEIGFKGSFLDGSLQLDAAAYYMDWSDLQARVLASAATGNFLILGNVGSADIKGFEMGALLRPQQAQNLTLGGNLTLLSAELSEGFPVGTNAFPGQKGDRIPDVPEVSGNLYAELVIPVLGNWEAITRFDYSYVGKSFRAFRPEDPTYRKQGDYSLANARVSFEDGEKYRVAVYVDNIFDENEVVTHFVDASQRRPDQVTGLQPRTIGVSLGYKF